MKMYFKGAKGGKPLVDSEGKEIKEGDYLTFDWFDNAFSTDRMRRLFVGMKTWTNEEITKRVNRATFVVAKNEKGDLFGKDIRENKNLYLHDFRFKYTKVVL